ncbi:hypothetical protein [Sphingomonas sp.]|uniref:hypothetical protein n=1 Tax=Sphingomonas sp. TaxID=28214 RepID=UPI001B02090B|nr:hypothetical protein [Sphingomonas sp.]MBO9714202.1 hypothetical protein [Sphingomonas sp.]
MPKALAQFSITRTGEDFLITLEDEDGDTIEFTADADQLDEVVDSIEEQLEAADEALVDDEEDEDEEGAEEEE